MIVGFLNEGARGRPNQLEANPAATRLTSGGRVGTWQRSMRRGACGGQEVRRRMVRCSIVSRLRRPFSVLRAGGCRAGAFPAGQVFRLLLQMVVVARPRRCCSVSGARIVAVLVPSTDPVRRAGPPRPCRLAVPALSLIAGFPCHQLSTPVRCVLAERCASTSRLRPIVAAWRGAGVVTACEISIAGFVPAGLNPYRNRR